MTSKYLTLISVEQKALNNAKITDRVDKIIKLTARYLDIIDIMKISKISKAFTKRNVKTFKNQIKTILTNGLSTKERIIYWRNMSNIYKSKQTHPTYYSKLIKSLSEDKQRISYDICRTFPEMEYFSNGKEGYIKMLNVLRAISEDNKKVGYTQGMNFLVALMLITHGKEEDAFWLLRFILNEPLYSYRDVIGGTMSKLKVLFYQLYRLIEKYFPSIYTQLVWV